MTAGCGLPYSTWWTDCVLDGWSLKTLSGLLPGFPPSSIDWPSSVTWDEVGFLPLPPLELATDENDGSLLPTPMANQSGKTPESHLSAKNIADGSNRSTITDLQILLRDCLLPTPTATAGWRFDAEGKPYGKAHPGLSLENWAMLPTPTATDGKGPSPASTARNGASRLRDVATYLPTPQAHDARGAKTPAQVQASRRRSGAGVANLNEVVLNLSSPECQTAPKEITGLLLENMQLF
jgi:hypothetical protein